MSKPPISRKPVIRRTPISGELFLRILAKEVSAREIQRECSHLNSQDLQNVRTYADSVLPLDLEERFHLLMHDGYWVLGNLTKRPGIKGYWAHYQLRAVRKDGGLAVAKRFLAKPDPQDGFDQMLELGLLHLSIEASVLRSPWSSLFSPQELETARRRLDNA